MKIYQFIKQESTAITPAVFQLTIISALANAFLLMIVNTSADIASNNEAVGARYFALYIISFLLLLLGKNFMLKRFTFAMEDSISKIRLRITNKIRECDLLLFETIGQPEIYSRLSKDTATLSQASMLIANSIHSAVMLVACTAYIAYLSTTGFIIIALMIGSGIIAYKRHEVKTLEYYYRAEKQNNHFFAILENIFSGFKEIKINTKKSDHIYDHSLKVSDKTFKINIKTWKRIIENFLLSEVVFYTLLASILFILPLFIDTHADIIMKLTASILFIMGPLEALVTVMPTLSRANLAVEHLQELESKVTIPQSQPQTHLASLKNYHSIDFKSAKFSYKDQTDKPLFTVGPFDLSIKRGEITFIVGGNGSGKSTFLKLLTTLYPLDSGHITVDNDTKLLAQHHNHYRDLFSVIFTDFHLFDRVYGIDQIDEEKLNYLLKLMEIDQKTEYVNGRFSTLNLSTGQRKRLALVNALLEDKDIYIFDEWAADQDPDFRRYFYEIILKDMRMDGKTIIAATHDDHYFHIADKIYKMDYGQLAPLK